MGCQVGKAYRVVLQEGDKCYSVLAILLAFSTQARKKSNQKGEESPIDKVLRLSSPRAWDVALIPFPEDFAPLPTQTETALPCMSSQLGVPAQPQGFGIQANAVSCGCLCRSCLSKWPPYRLSMGPLCWAFPAMRPFRINLSVRWSRCRVCMPCLQGWPRVIRLRIVRRQLLSLKPLARQLAMTITA